MKRRDFLYLLGTASGVVLASVPPAPAAASTGFWYRRAVPGVKANATPDPRPKWITDADLGTQFEGDDLVIDLLADGATSYEIIAGELPVGIGLSSAGQLAGRLPTIFGSIPFSFTVRASNADGSADRTFSMLVAETPSGSMQFTGSASFTVPAGVRSIRMKVWGAGGASGSAGNNDVGENGGAGGGGGYAGGLLAVTPGEVLTVIIGEGGSTSSTIRRGGGGGGGSAVLRGGTTLVAAGGGGGGGGGYRGTSGFPATGGTGANSPLPSEAMAGESAPWSGIGFLAEGGFGSGPGGAGGFVSRNGNGGGGGGYPGGLAGYDPADGGGSGGFGGYGGYGITPMGGAFAAGSIAPGNSGDHDWVAPHGTGGQAGSDGSAGLIVFRWGVGA